MCNKRKWVVTEYVQMHQKLNKSENIFPVLVCFHQNGLFPSEINLHVFRALLSVSIRHKPITPHTIKPNSGDQDPADKTEESSCSWWLFLKSELFLMNFILATFLWKIQQERSFPFPSDQRYWISRISRISKIPRSSFPPLLYHAYLYAYLSLSKNSCGIPYIL